MALKRSKGMNFNIHSALKEALRSLGLDAKMKGYAAWGIWDKIVGETVAHQAQPAFLRGGILFVQCSSPAWMQQLQFMKGMILEELYKRVGKGVIKDIRFQLGVIVRPHQGEPSAGSEEVVLDDAEQARIDEALCPLQDPEIREIARRIMVKEASVKKTLHR